MPRSRWIRWLKVAGVLAFPVLVLGTEFGRTLLGIRDAQEHAWSLLDEEGAYQLRAYEPVAVATTVVEPGPRRPGNVAFRRLAGYIFGRNRAREKIAMTTPVIQEGAGEKLPMTAPVTREDSPEGYRFTFVLPGDRTLEDLPAPVDERVVLGELPARTVVVVRFSGWAGPADMERRREELAAWARARGWEPAGEPRLAYYDPPWTIPFLRRNEVQLSVVSKM